MAVHHGGRGPGHLARLLGTTVAVDPGVLEWPNYPVTITEDLSTFGSSTETAFAPTPIEWLKTDYAPTANYVTTIGTPSGAQCFMNWAAGGSNSDGMVTAFTGAPARVKAATGNLLIGGAYESQNSPVPHIIANVDTIVAAAGHTNYVIAPKHSDGASISASGAGPDWHRAREICRRVGAPSSPYWGWISDTTLFNRRFSTPRDSTDVATKLTDRVQNSWWGGTPAATAHTDQAHMQGDDVAMGYYGGSHARAQYVQAPYYASRIAGNPAFIPHQNRYSAETTNQTAGGFVCNIATRGSLTGHTADVLYTDNTSASAEWSVSIVSGVLKLYRAATATYNTNGYTVLKVRIIRNGKANWAYVKIYLLDLTPDGSKSAYLNSQWLVREDAFGGNITGPAYSFAICLRPRWAAGDAAAKVVRTTVGSGGGGPFMQIKGSANQNVGMSMPNTSAATGFNFDQPTSQGFTNGRGLQWLFGAFDTATAGAATGGGTGKIRTDSLGVNTLSAVSTTGTVNLGTDLNIATIGNQVFPTIGSSVAAGGSLMNADIVCIWEAPGYVDWGNTAMLDLVRDPTTRKPVLGTTRGSDAPGTVNGLAPINWMQGPAGNWAAGANLAKININDGTYFWDATDRVDPEGGVAITTVNT